MIKITNDVYFNPITFQYFMNNKNYSLSNIIPKENKSIITGNNIKYVSIFVTNECNLCCPYCYEKNKKKQTMDIDCINRICMLFGNKIEKFQFFGGEPLLEKDFIKSAHSILYNANPKIIFSIITNSLLLDNDFISWISSSNRTQIGVSWDGFGDLSRYGYDSNKSDLVLKNIKLLQDNDIKVSVRLTISETNIQDLIKSFKYLSINDIPLDIEPVFDYTKMDITDHIKDILVEFYEGIGDNICKLGTYHTTKKLLASGMFKYYGCAAGRHSVRIDTNGNIYDCHRMMPNKENYMGNIFDINDISQIDNNKYYSYKCNIRDECMNCEYRFLCGGGCLYSHSENYCNVIKSKYRAILRGIWNESKESLMNSICTCGSLET